MSSENVIVICGWPRVWLLQLGGLAGMIVGAVPLSSSRLSSSSRLGRRAALRREFWCAVRLVWCFPKSRRNLFHFISLPSAISRHLSSLAVSSLVVSESPSGFCQKAQKDAELDLLRC